MRGFPLVQALLVALGMAVLWGPLSATMHSGAGGPAAGLEGGAPGDVNGAGDVLVEADGEWLPMRLHVRWTRPPVRLLVEVEGEALVAWDEDDGPGEDELSRGELEREWSARWDDLELDVWVEAMWPQGEGGGREALEVRLEPEGHEGRALVVWGEDEAVDGTVMSWREEGR